MQEALEEQRNYSSVPSEEGSDPERGALPQSSRKSWWRLTLVSVAVLAVLLVATAIAVKRVAEPATPPTPLNRLPSPRVEIHDGDFITLRCRATSLYLRAADGGEGFGISTSKVPNTWEMLQVVAIPGSTTKFALKTHHGKYLSASDSYKSFAIVSADVAKGWESFEFIGDSTAGASWFRIKTYHGLYMRGSSSAFSQASKFDDYELLEVVKVSTVTPNWNSYINGVNLGGWLVLENWITDALMEGTNDEWSLIKKKGGATSSAAQTTMRNHWDTFFTEPDIEQLFLYGITHIRIPIGWWIVDYVASDGFVDGGWPYLERVLGWIGQRGMLAVLDLHAMPGAQTPYQSFTGKSEDRAYFFEDAAKTTRGVDICVKLAKKIKALETHADYRLHNVVMGIELVNEPSNAHWQQTKDFYARAVPAVRNILEPSRYAILLSYMNSARDAAPWQRDQMDDFPAVWDNVIFDRHVYHAYGDDDVPPWAPWLPRPAWRDDMDACKTCCRDGETLYPVVDERLPVLFGEWALNTATVNEGNEKSEKFLREYFGLQLSLWRHAATGGSGPYSARSRGHFFWTAKIHVEEDDYFINFDLLKLIRRGIVGDTIGAHDVSVLCPPIDRSRCPVYDRATVDWDSNCDFR